MAPSKTGNKGNNGPLPQPPMEQDDRQTRPASRDMPGTYVAAGQVLQQQQVQMTGRQPEDRDSGYRESEQRHDNRRQDQKHLPDSLRDRDSDGRRGHGSVWSGLSKFGKSVSNWTAYPEDQFAEPESHHSDRGGRSDHRNQYEDKRERRQYSGSEEVYRLRQDLAEKQAYIDSLRNALESEKLTTSKVKLSADKMQLVMDNKDLFVGVQQNDDVIMTKFRNLFGQITTWSKRFRKNDNADFDSLGEQTRVEFERVAPGCLTTGPIVGQEQPRLWDSARMIRMLIQGWVGLIVSEKLFRSLSGVSVPNSAAKDVWMGDNLDRNVGTIEYKLAKADRGKVGLRELHDWRSLTIELLSRVDMGAKAEQEKDATIQVTAKEIMDVAAIWAPADALPELHDRLLKILTEAMTFSQLLRRQRGCWSIHGAPPAPPVVSPRDGSQPLAIRQRVAFNRLTMKDHGELEDDYGEDHGVPPKDVELFITPGLFKRGAADGEHFETDSCIASIQVLCFEQ